MAEYDFVFTPSNALTNSHKIYIVFPNYYQPRVGYEGIYCTIDNDPVHCSIFKDYTVKVEFFT